MEGAWTDGLEATSGFTRRSLLQHGMAFTSAAATAGSARAADARFRILATGLVAPESPKILADGSVLVVEMGRGTLSRVLTDGRIQVVATLGGSPNGVAIGPDAAAYVLVSPGVSWLRQGDQFVPNGPLRPPHQAGVVRVDLSSGAHQTLYTQVDGVSLSAPNDLVFDRTGGFWFTDLAGGAVFWALADGSRIQRAAAVERPNGIVLSPDQTRLFCVSGSRVLTFTVAAPGRLATDAAGLPIATPFCEAPFGRFDSMAADADGGLAVGTLFAWPPPALSPETRGGISRFDPTGRLMEVVRLPDPLVTNLSFGGMDMRTAYATMTSTGRLAAVEWARPGLKLTNQ